MPASNTEDTNAEESEIYSEKGMTSERSMRKTVRWKKRQPAASEMKGTYFIVLWHL